MEGKIAVLGDADFVMPFSAFGLDTFAVDADKDRILADAQKILDENYTLVIVAEDIAPVADEVFSAKLASPLPGVIVVPFTKESQGYATEALGEVLKLATGINILQND